MAVNVLGAGEVIDGSLWNVGAERTFFDLGVGKEWGAYANGVIVSVCCFSLSNVLGFNRRFSASGGFGDGVWVLG